jgi:superoxide dismutase, Cu-Zn family
MLRGMLRSARLPLPVILILALVAYTSPAARAQDDDLRIELYAVDGALVGAANVIDAGGPVFIWVDVWDLPPGFHGFHVHSVGMCDGSSAFQSAGGHLDAEGAQHGDHAGDLPSLYVTAEGTGFLSFVTDRFTLQMLLDRDGSALIVHADPDNFAHLPDRYGVTLDQTTLTTGDAGARIACGRISAG